MAAGPRMEAGEWRGGAELERTVAGKTWQDLWSLTSGSAVPRCCHLSASGSSDLSFPPCCRQGTELTRIMCKEGTAASEGLTGGIL